MNDFVWTYEAQTKPQKFKPFITKKIILSFLFFETFFIIGTLMGNLAEPGQEIFCMYGYCITRDSN